MTVARCCMRCMRYVRQTIFMNFFLLLIMFCRPISSYIQYLTFYEYQACPQLVAFLYLSISIISIHFSVSGDPHRGHAVKRCLRRWCRNYGVSDLTSFAAPFVGRNSVCSRAVARASNGEGRDVDGALFNMSWPICAANCSSLRRHVVDAPELLCIFLRDAQRLGNSYLLYIARRWSEAWS